MKKVCVIGGANIDICGASLEPLREFDSNPGKISISFGGVGRNIAQICALLGMPTVFMSCFSDDEYGRLMKEDCIRLGMDVSDCITVKDLPSSMYLAILDSDNDMRIAMSDMRILRRMSPEVLSGVLKKLGRDDIIIIDANLDMECIGYILENAPCRIAADPVSTGKAKRLLDYLKYLTIFKPNRFEAEEMNGIAITDPAAAAESASWFRDQGVKEVIISLADQGVLLAEGNDRILFRHRVISLENATGGGDSLLGAYIAGRLEGLSPRMSMGLAVSCAVTSIEHDAVSRRSLNIKTVRDNISSMCIEEEAI